jgi:hypothetical protein
MEDIENLFNLDFEAEELKESDMVVPLLDPCSGESDASIPTATSIQKSSL